MFSTLAANPLERFLDISSINWHDGNEAEKRFQAAPVSDKGQGSIQAV